MSAFYVKIIASDHVFYEGKCTMLVIPAIDGEQAIMAHHEEMVIATMVGELRFQKEDDTWFSAIVGIGIAQIANNRVTVLVDTAERPEDIDEKRAEEAMERAQEQMRQKQSIQEYHMSQASLARAIYRLKTKKKYRGY